MEDQSQKKRVRPDEEGVEKFKMELPMELEQLDRHINDTQRRVLRKKVARTVQVAKLREALAMVQKRAEDAESKFKGREVELLELNQAKATLEEQLKALQGAQQDSQTDMVQLETYRNLIKDELENQIGKLEMLNLSFYGDIKVLEKSLDEDDRREAYKQYLTKVLDNLGESANLEKILDNAAEVSDLGVILNELDDAETTEARVIIVNKYANQQAPQ